MPTLDSELPIIGHHVIRGGHRSNAPKVEIQQRYDASQAPKNEYEREKLKSEMHFAKVIGEALHGFYPGHFWKVEVDFRGGVAKISIPLMMGPTGCYIMPLHLYSTAHVMKAGGMILEYFKIPRSSLDLGLAHFIEAKESKPARERMHKFDTGGER